MNNNILITGGAGFIGYVTAKQLSEDENNHLIIMDNLKRGRLDDELNTLTHKPNVTFLEGDITDSQCLPALNQPFDYIYHFAAMVGVKNVMSQPDRVLFVNTVGTLNLLDFASRQDSLKKLLFASTSEVYSGTLRHYGIPIPTNEDVNLTIDDISSPRTTYALSKIFGESACFSHNLKNGLPFTIVRYHNVYGPRMGFSHVIPEMFIKINNNINVKVPSPEHTRAFCYVDDAAEMTIRLTNNDAANKQIYHIGNGTEEIKIKELVKKIAEVMDKQIAIEEMPVTPGSPERRCPDVSKAMAISGYKPLTGLTAGLKETYNWYKDKLNKPYE